MKYLVFSLLGPLLFASISCNDKTVSQNKHTKLNINHPVDLKVNNYLLTATGQTKTYNNSTEVVALKAEDAFYGQDAHYLSGEEMSYQNNGNGTVTDLKTGLMWQATPKAREYNWQDAVDYCESLELAGYDDWRIPSAKELFSISNFSKGWPYIDINYFHLAEKQVTKDEQYWSNNYYQVGTTHHGQASAFGVNYGTGHIKAYPNKGRGNYVRAVRGSQYGINKFKDNYDGTITDESTGLMWMQRDFGLTLDWEHALLFADTFTYVNYDDWRLPNVKELQSIVDYSGTFPAISTLFISTPIKNEAGNVDYGYYWTSTSAYFGKNAPAYYYAWYVAFGRAVDKEGEDTHGAGAVRFDTKVEGGPASEGGERVYNYVRLVRGN